MELRRKEGEVGTRTGLRASAPTVVKLVISRPTGKSVTFNCVICGHTESSPRDNGKANAGNGNGGFNASSTGSASAASGAFSYSKFTL